MPIASKTVPLYWYDIHLSSNSEKPGGRCGLGYIKSTFADLLRIHPYSKLFASNFATGNVKTVVMVLIAKIF